MFKPQDYTYTHVSRALTSAQGNLLQGWRADIQASEGLGHLGTSTLVITGTDDEVFDKQNSVILAGTILNAKLVEVQAGGHAMMYQYPKILAAQINAFIQN